MAPRPVALDPATLRILERLQQDSEISIADLAEKVGLSTSPCWRRVNDLKDAGVIRGCVAVVDPLSLGLAVNVFVHVSLEKQTQAALQAFDEAVRNRPEVMECYLMSGEADYMLRVVVEDLGQYQKLRTRPSHPDSRGGQHPLKLRAGSGEIYDGAAARASDPMSRVTSTRRTRYWYLSYLERSGARRANTGTMCERRMVEPNGIEPMTSSMPWKRSPS